MKLHKRQATRDLAALTVERLKQRYADRAAQMQCPVHHRRPVVQVKGEALATLRIEVEGCCLVFVRQVREALKTGS